MGIKDNRKMVSVRVTAEQDALIARQVKASGLSQQSWMLSKVLTGAALATINNPAPIKGANAKLAIARGNLKVLGDKTNISVLLHEGYLWLVTKSSNGRQEVLTAISYCPKEVYALIETDNPLTLKELEEAIQLEAG
jgi:hypothetical protein